MLPAILLHGKSLCLIFNRLIVSDIFVEERKFDGTCNVYLSKFIVFLLDFLKFSHFEPNSAIQIRYLIVCEGKFSHAPPHLNPRNSYKRFPCPISPSRFSRANFIFFLIRNYILKNLL